MEMPTDIRAVRELAELAAREASERARERRAMCITGQECWYITRRSRRFHEDDARELLEDNQCDLYLPKMRRMIKIPNHRLTIKQRRSGITYKEPKLVPLMPYMFVNFDRRRKDWRELFERAHIQGMIFSEEAGETVPVRIRTIDIERMQSVEIEGAIPETLPVREWAFKVGEEVKVVGTAYAGFPGVIADLPEKFIGDVDEEIIFKITIWLFGRPNLIELPLSAIAKL